MSRETEIIITYNQYDKKAELFVTWLKGWARSEFNASVSYFGPGVDELSIAGADMFKVFTRLYRKAEIMRQRLGVDKVAVAICEADECIDMSSTSWPKIILPEGSIEILEKVAKRVKGLIVWEKLDDVYVEDHGGFIRISTKCCSADLQVDEAVMVARRLLDELHTRTKFQLFLEAGSEISKVFDPLELAHIPHVDLRHVKEGLYTLSIEFCSEIYMTADEILRLIYKVLDTAVFKLKFWKEEGEELAAA